MAASITVSLKLMFCLLSKKVVHCLCIVKKVKKYNFLYSLSRKRYCENVKIGPKEVCTEKVNVHVFVTNKGISETPTELTFCDRCFAKTFRCRPRRIKIVFLFFAASALKRFFWGPRGGFLSLLWYYYVLHIAQ